MIKKTSLLFLCFCNVVAMETERSSGKKIDEETYISTALLGTAAIEPNNVTSSESDTPAIKSSASDSSSSSYKSNKTNKSSTSISVRDRELEAFLLPEADKEEIEKTTDERREAYAPPLTAENLIRHNSSQNNEELAEGLHSVDNSPFRHSTTEIAANSAAINAETNNLTGTPPIDLEAPADNATQPLITPGDAQSNTPSTSWSAAIKAKASAVYEKFKWTVSYFNPNNIKKTPAPTDTAAEQQEDAEKIADRKKAAKQVAKEISAASTLTGLMTFLGWYWGGSLQPYEYPTIVNAGALAFGEFNASRVENQPVIKKLLLLGCPMLALYIMNYYAFDNLNPYPGNQFFFALSFTAMQELRILAGRSPNMARSLYTWIQNKVPRRAIETAELATLAGSATALGVTTDALKETIVGSYTFLPFLYASIESRNVAEMINRKRHYLLRATGLLTAAGINELFNYFVCDKTRPEIAALFFFAWLRDSTETLKRVLKQPTEPVAETSQQPQENQPKPQQEIPESNTSPTDPDFGILHEESSSNDEGL
ncbi:hypothetical protein M1466_01570 [Candidatus Dependentiae bacterium]|nr:hypothetical protein [Candidatus Dependentiae bacterium]